MVQGDSPPVDGGGGEDGVTEVAGQLAEQKLDDQEAGERRTSPVTDPYSSQSITLNVRGPINTLRSRQMAAISQTTFSNAFSCMKMYGFRLRFHLILYLRVQLTIFQHWFR